MASASALRLSLPPEPLVASPGRPPLRTRPCQRQGLAVGLRVCAVVVLAAGISLSTAFAQQLPSSVDPNRLEQRFERPQRPQSKPPVALPAPEQAPAPEAAGTIKFELSAVVVDAGTVFSQADLAPLWQPLLGHEISLLDLYKLRDAITVKYRNAGYLLSVAVIPAQEIAGGIVHLAIVEGHLNKVIFDGDAADRFGLLEDYAERLKASRPLQAAVLERYVLLIDDLPGITARTVIKPSEGDAAGSDLTVIIERKPIGASLALDNRGTKSTGPYQIDGSVDFNDVLGVFEQTTLRGILTPQVDELRYFDLSHTEQLGHDGTTLQLGARRNWSEPGDTLRPFEVKSVSSTLHLGLAYPLIRSRSETLRLAFDLTYRNSRTNVQGDKLNDDRVRFVSLGASYDVSDAWQGSNLFQIGLNRGFDILNASSNDDPAQSREGARNTFTKLTVSAQRLQPLPERFSVLVGTEGQYSRDLLVSAEEFGFGGGRFGRAFDSSEIAGDKGAAAKLELQYTPEIEVPALQFIQLYGYTDYGWTWNYQPGDQPARQELGSFGAGIRFAIANTVSGSVEFGKPYHRNTSVNGNKDPRVFFSLTARY